MQPRYWKRSSIRAGFLIAPAGMLLLGVSAIHAMPPAADTQKLTPGLTKKHSQPEVVDIELLTWPEIYKAIHEQGKTTAIIFDGGTEQRGPQGVTGAHNFIARATADEIARKLGNALVAPIIPYSVNKANADLPGTIGISGPVFAEVNEQVAEQLIANGFKNVVLIGDHGGGQKEIREVAARLDAKYASQGIR